MSDYLLNMIWTISAGLLSLVALLGIFVSISSQQKIQKRRELFWELFQPEQRTFDRSALSTEQIVANASYLQKRYRLYSYLEENEAKGILPHAIDAGVLLMKVVVVFWGIGISVAIFSVYNKAIITGLSICELLPDIFFSLIFIILLLLSTYAMEKIRIVTEQLRKPWANEELPATKDILNVLNETGSIDVLDYLMNTLLVSLRLNRFENKDWLQLRLVYPLPFYGFSVTSEIQVRYQDGTMKMYTYGKETIVEYNEKHSPSETAAPVVWNFELSEGVKDKIATIKASIKIQSGAQKKEAIVHGETDLSELNDWRREKVYILSWMTGAEMEKWDENRGKVVVGFKIE